jgi:hypothetical protein
VLAQGGERFGAALERAGQIFGWSWQRRGSDVVAQILKIIHFFGPAPR